MEAERHCEYCNGKDKIQEHHLHCRFLDNPSGNGMKIDLCEKCHNVLHFIIPKLIWEYVPADKRKECIDSVKSFTLKHKKYPYGVL